jgi:flagellar motor switch protein FliM
MKTVEQENAEIREPQAPLEASSTDPAECRPELLLPDQVDLASRAFRTFLEGASRSLLNYLGSPVELRFAGASQASGEAFHLESTGSRISLDLSPSPGYAHLLLGSGFVSAVLATLLGAPPEDQEAARDSFTEVDYLILQPLVELLAGALRTAWQPVSPAAFRLVPGDRKAGDPSDPSSMLVLTAEIGFRNLNDTLKLAVPSLLLRLASQPRISVDPAASRRDRMAEALAPARFEVEAVLRGAGIRIRDLLDLHPGHTLELPHAADTPVDCQVNGVVKFRGELVLSGTSLGVQVQSRLAPPEDAAVSAPQT